MCRRPSGRTTGWNGSLAINSQIKRRDDLPRRQLTGEESPDRKGRFTAESADGSNLVEAVTENNRISGCKGENVRQELTTEYGDMLRVRS